MPAVNSTPTFAGVDIASILVNGIAAVAGKTAVTTPALIALVAVDPATVKKSAGTPVNV